MFGLESYAESFKKGLNYVLYDSEEDTRVEPKLDKSNLESIGYYDGYQYGEYLEMTSQTMSVSQEQLIAVIDKNHTKAINTYMKNEDKYVRYKSGFVDGKLDIMEKIINKAGNLDELPKYDDDDFISLGYYDGYSYFLNDYLQNGMIKRNDGVNLKIEEIARFCFNKREKLSEKGQAK